MGGEEKKGVWRFILVTSFVKNAEANGRIWQVVFPSPPGPLLPTNSGLAWQNDRFARPNFWGEGEPRCIFFAVSFLK